MRLLPGHAAAPRAAGVLALAALSVWAFSAGRSADPGGTTRAASQPATSTAPARDVARLARQAAANLLARLDNSFRAVVRPPFVVVGNLPEMRLRQMADASVVAPAAAMWSSYFRRRPADAITVLLFRDDRSYRLWAEKLFGDKAVPYFGYYKPSRRTLVMNIATGTGTLAHELTHALITYDFPSVPTWFNEGLASLHEQCYVRPGRIVGAVNWRLPALQRAVKARTLRPLAELITQRDFYGRQQGLNYAQARYFVMYMQQRGLLRKFYEHFRDHHAGSGADAKAVEHVFDAELAKVEASFLQWVMTLPWPAR